MNYIDDQKTKQSFNQRHLQNQMQKQKIKQETFCRLNIKVAIKRAILSHLDSK